MKVKKITPSEKHKDVFYADFEEGGSLRLGVAQIADFSLFTGRELTDEEFAELEASASRWNCLSRALRLAGYRPLSRKELTDKLLQKGESPESAEYAADRLEAMGILNDRDYGFMIVRHYAAKGYGAARVRNELYSRGVPKEYWDDALAEMPDQTDTISHLMDLRLKSDNPDRKELKKLSEYLYRRGFSWDEIREAMDSRFGDDF